MSIQNSKCVMIINETLPVGLISNTAAILGITLGKHFPEAVGEDVTDRTGNKHLGIIAIPVPILKGDPALLRALREQLHQPEYADITVADFSDVAQGCNDYEKFAQKMAEAPGDELQYYGIAICGDKKRINKLTGSLPLLR